MPAHTDHSLGLVAPMLQESCGARAHYDREPSLRLRMMFAQLDRRAARGGLRAVCPHPGQGAAVALWRPEEIVCELCLSALMEGLEDITSWRCDRCQLVLAEGDETAPAFGICRTRRLTVFYRLCEICIAKDASRSDASARR